MSERVVVGNRVINLDALDMVIFNYGIEYDHGAKRNTCVFRATLWFARTSPILSGTDATYLLHHLCGESAASILHDLEADRREMEERAAELNAEPAPEEALDSMPF